MGQPTAIYQSGTTVVQGPSLAMPKGWGMNDDGECVVCESNASAGVVVVPTLSILRGLSQ
eukprot:COSAG05_NODE_324_length_11401_cov_6.009379_7_plen_60_part_00